MPHRSILAALAAIVVTITFATVAIAATGPPEPPATCITVASELRLIHELGAGIQIRVWRGDDALRMRDVLLELDAPAESHDAIQAATAFLLMIGGDNADPPAILKMFGGDGCAFYALATDHAGAARLQERMGLSL